MFTIAAFYKFIDLADFAGYRSPLLDVCRTYGVKGTILLAGEGVNGTVSGTAAGIDAVIGALRALPGLGDLAPKLSFAEDMAFKRMKVRLKDEIVTMGVPTVDASKDAGVYVPPEDWNDLISADDVAVIDARNAYEITIGAFENAVDPKTSSFREFPAWLETFKQTTPSRKLAMYCTGGIRCEKATALAKAIGFEEVYHLEGGILRYLEKTPKEESKWRGECYVFDERVSVGHGLEAGDYSMCRACGLPVSPAGRESEHYVEGVSCEACWRDYSDEQKARFAERQHHYERAAAGRGKARPSRLKR
jgi:UPF0176 protein